MVSEQQVTAFFQSEQERLERQQEARAREKGYVDFFSVPVGETSMTVKHQVPRMIETKYGARKVFRIIVDGKEYDFSVNERSPLYRYLIGSLASTQDDVALVLVRTGNGKSTKYDVKEA